MCSSSFMFPQKCKCIELKQSTSLCPLNEQPLMRDSRHFRGKWSSEVCFKHLEFCSTNPFWFRNLIPYNLQHFYFTFFKLYLLKRLSHYYDVVILHCPAQSLAPRLNIPCLFPFVLLFSFQFYVYSLIYGLQSLQSDIIAQNLICS